jgi:hypothetical protein
MPTNCACEQQTPLAMNFSFSCDEEPMEFVERWLTIASAAAVQIATTRPKDTRVGSIA